MTALAKTNALSPETLLSLHKAEKARQSSEENIALLALQQKDFSRAVDIYKSLIREEPNNPGFWHNLSIVLRYERHYWAALGCATRAVSLAPASLGHAVNLSDCLLPLDKLDEALAILSRAVDLDPQNAACRHRYATALREAGRLEEALAQAATACNLEPDSVEANWQYAVTNLALGNLSAGWKGYEMRWKRGTLKEKNYKARRWTGEDLTGKTILLHEEQGFGDTILAARYIPLVKERGAARIILGCRPDLHALFKNIPGLDELTDGGSFSLDFHAPLMSLPGIFGTELDTIPPPARLSPAQAIPSKAAELLNMRSDHFRVGIIWSGNPDFKDNHRRAVAFSRFLSLTEIPSVQLYSLQKGAPEKELHEAGAQSLVWDLGPHLKNFAGTAAVLKELDLVIMTDSSVAHLAGSMGCPVWNLLNYSPSWLYLTKRNDSPWYPSMKLFRQPTPGDWYSVFSEVATELKMAVALEQAKKRPASKRNSVKKPEILQTLKNKGIELLKEKNWSQATECLTEIVKHDPANAPGWSNLGSALRHRGKFEAAACCSKRALQISPQDPAFLANYGNVLVDINRVDESNKIYEQALRLKPGDQSMRYNYALGLREANRLQEAVNIFEDLFKKEPGNVEIVWDAAMALLAGGNFKNGWSAFESRRQRPGMQRDRVYKTAAPWRGEELKGKTILVYEEQGFGDTILCSRYIPLLHKLGAQVFLECKSPLHRLFSTLPGVTRIAAEGQITGGFDYHIPLMGLPRLMGTDTHNIPAPPSLYVPGTPPPSLSRLLERGKNNFKVGIVWSGNIDFPGNRKRAVDIERFLSFACIPGVQLYSLQKGPREQDLAACGATELILELGPHLKDFSDTAVVLKQLDLVIMTDSSVAHLAGSLGVPVWNLLHYHPYWLYQTKGRDCPWYPSMRLFRQPVPGDWDSVFREVATELRKAVQAPHHKTAAQPPQNAENWRRLGHEQFMQKKYAEAAESYRQCLQINPHHEGVFVDFIGTFCNRRLFDEAHKEIDNRLAHIPNDVQSFTARAWVLKFQNRLPEAIESLGKALALNPNHVTNLLTMARFMESSDRPKANEYLRQAVTASKGSMRTLLRLCSSLNRSRYGSEAAHIQESYALACDIVKRFPSSSLLGDADVPRDVLLRCVDYERLDSLPDEKTLIRHWVNEGRIEPLLHSLSRVKTYEDRLGLVKYHRAWGDKIEEQIALTPIKRTPVPARSKIRIGFMSSDLRDHPVSYFALPLLENFDRDRFEVYCYSFYTGKEDPLQKKITSDVTAFRWWPHRQNFDVAQGIADDQLDILFELGGPTDMNKVQVMPYRAAPVQASWLGYPHSMGFSSIDYIFVDPFVKPEDPRLLVEKPFEVPETWISLGRLRFHDNPPINPDIPQNRNGGLLTFGTMNNPYKYTPELIATWAEILTQVPNSRFMFVRPEGNVPAFRVNMAKEFAKHGIAENRLAYISIRGANLPYYNEIDIALDTFPQVGGTTTCETVWMGVPVISLVGPALFERLSYSILNNAGLGDLCAFTREDYIAKAITLAGDKKLREKLRTSLRAQIRNRPLGQTERFTENFYKKIESVLK